MHACEERRNTIESTVLAFLRLSVPALLPPHTDDLHVCQVLLRGKLHAARALARPALRPALLRLKASGNSQMYSLCLYTGNILGH